MTQRRRPPHVSGVLLRQEFSVDPSATRRAAVSEVSAPWVRYAPRLAAAPVQHVDCSRSRRRKGRA
jgi:hypothetical protein